MYKKKIVHCKRDTAGEENWILGLGIRGDLTIVCAQRSGCTELKASMEGQRSHDSAGPYLILKH